MNHVKNTSGNPTKTDEGFLGTHSLNPDGQPQVSIPVREIEHAEAQDHWRRGRGILIDGVEFAFSHADSLTSTLVFVKRQGLLGRAVAAVRGGAE